MNNFYWPKMTRDMDKYYKTCFVSQQAKNPTQKPYVLFYSLPIPNKPFTYLTMDFLTLPAVIDYASKVHYSYVWIIVCRLTKHSLVLPLQDGYTTELHINLFMFHIYLHSRYPLNIVEITTCSSILKCGLGSVHSTTSTSHSLPPATKNLMVSQKFPT